MAGYMKITERGDVRYSIFPYTPKEQPARPLFKGRPVRNPGFGSKPIPKSPRPMPHYRIPGARALPWLGLGLTVVDLVDNLVITPKEDPYDTVPAGWQLCWVCPDPPPRFLGSYRVETLNLGCPSVSGCAQGQGDTGALLVPPADLTHAMVSFPNSQYRNIHKRYWFNTAQTVVRTKQWKHFRRTVSGAQFNIQFKPFAYAPYDMLDPNIMRQLPGSEPYPAEPPPAPLPDPAGGEWQWRSDGPPNPPPRPHMRQPPRGRNKERKARSRSAAVGIALFRALDWISEAAEVVDALYDALPADVKARWGRGRDGRGFVDQAGQYGIDGADWKLQALYHNWHKVDVPLAIKNIVKNGVEDKVIGGISRTVPKQVINAFERQLPAGKSISPELYISQFVDWVFDEGIEL